MSFGFFRRNPTLIEDGFHILLKFRKIGKAEYLINKLSASNSFYWLFLTVEAPALQGAHLLPGRWFSFHRLQSKPPKIPPDLFVHAQNFQAWNNLAEQLCG